MAYAVALGNCSFRLSRGSVYEVIGKRTGVVPIAILVSDNQLKRAHTPDRQVSTDYLMGPWRSCEPEGGRTVGEIGVP